MHKKLWLVLFLVISSPVLADLNNTVKNVTSCLKGTSGGSKADCVQAQINAEKNNQIATLFQVYATAANRGIDYYGAQPSISTPNSPGGKGFDSASTGANQGGNAAPGATANPAQGTIQTPPPPTGQSPGGTTVPSQPSPQGGIQYY